MNHGLSLFTCGSMYIQSNTPYIVFTIPNSQDISAFAGIWTPDLPLRWLDNWRSRPLGYGSRITMTTYFAIFSEFVPQIVFYDVVRKISDKDFLRVGIFVWSSDERPRVVAWSIDERTRVVAWSIGKRPRVVAWSIGKRTRVGIISTVWSIDKRPTSFLKKIQDLVKNVSRLLYSNHLNSEHLNTGFMLTLYSLIFWVPVCQDKVNRVFKPLPNH